MLSRRCDKVGESQWIALHFNPLSCLAFSQGGTWILHGTLTFQKKTSFILKEKALLRVVILFQCCSKTKSKCKLYCKMIIKNRKQTNNQRNAYSTIKQNIPSVGGIEKPRKYIYSDTDRSNKCIIKKTTLSAIYHFAPTWCINVLYYTSSLWGYDRFQWIIQ